MSKRITPQKHLERENQLHSITRYYHHRDIFLTMMVNPRWEDITSALLGNQQPHDRPDLVARVFELKCKALIKEIQEKNVFGRMVGYVYTIEFQKRGLPHMHMLIFLDKEDKIHTPEQVDKIVCAEFPDDKQDPELFRTIQRCMVHGPCGARKPSAFCMENGKCTKNYPKQYAESTSISDNGYPIYRRRQDHCVFKYQNQSTNMDVVPYNPHLSRMFDCHINVEVCSSVLAVKYIHKYIYKGHDLMTIVASGGPNEILQYLNARYIGAPDAAWRLLGNRMHKENPKVQRLAVHLPGKQRDDPEDPVEVIQDKADIVVTTLMGYFDYYRLHPRAKAYTYQDFPPHFVWSGKVWTPRKQGYAIGRMYFVAPNSGELYYLRLVLTVVAGARSFKHLRTTMNSGVQEVHRTFKSACIALNLLEDDGECDKCLKESVVIKTAHQLRQLFGLILTKCNPTRPEVLWERYGKDICDDLPFRIKRQYEIENPTEEQVLDYGLYLMEKIVQEEGKEMKDLGMPQHTGDWSRIVGNRLIWEQRQLQFDIQKPVVDSNVEKFNAEQRLAFETITDSVVNNLGKTFFLNGSAGTGKTFVYNTLAATHRSSKGDVVLTVSSCGVSALLLTGGRTAHSTFKIPFEPQSDSKCNVDFDSIEAELFRATKLIIWDEVAMQHRFCIEAVDRTLRDVRSSSEPFGGITVVLGGDFKQTLPVVQKGRREQIIDASVRSSVLWRDVNVLKLTQNMRLESQDPDSIAFAEYLLQVGENPEPKVNLPSAMSKCVNLHELISKIYPRIEEMRKPFAEYMTERTILSPRNDEVSEINLVFHLCYARECF
ncbi:uncharacterized protein LOC113276364 [Papaver somniferum]|uniref:uncharacterized protein LOC113276364 n=1 Tax=Papaver somniferum TaxID=3469 RepID=UPI000E6F7BE8|nr:uncharacterized protein LOC113276364 [Papaver somniferum]XP_026381747.1 uncharacterized protein LOC113276364 [Papaver somniferum]